MNNTITLPYLVELTDEKKVKVCIIEKLVKLAMLDGSLSPTWDEFVNMYEKDTVDLIQLKNNIEVIRKINMSIKEYQNSKH